MSYCHKEKKERMKSALHKRRIFNKINERKRIKKKVKIE